MKIRKVKNRSVIFTYYNSPDWDLHLHLIMGQQYNYLIDTGLGSNSIEPVMDYIGEAEKPLIVINTHHHWDHIWGNGSFHPHLIISHALCSRLMDENWDIMLQENRQYVDGEAIKRLPDLVFDNEIYFPSDKIRIIYTPGHTIDSVSVLDEQDKVLNAGDNIGDNMDKIVPELDCERSVYINTLKEYQKLGFDTLVSGHNDVLDKKVINEILKHF